MIENEYEYDAAYTNEYDSVYDSDDELPEYTNEQLDFLADNYPGKYIGGTMRKKMPYIQEIIQKRITDMFALSRRKEMKKVKKPVKQEIEKAVTIKLWDLTPVTASVSSNVDNMEFPAIGEKPVQNTNEWQEVKIKKQSPRVPEEPIRKEYKKKAVSPDKICSNAFSNKHCNCALEHDIKLLQPIKCKFDKECRRRKKPKADGTCQYIHTGETMDMFVYRMYGISKKTPPTPVKQPVHHVQPVAKAPIKNPWTRNQPSMSVPTPAPVNHVPEPVVEPVQANTESDGWTTVKNQKKSPSVCSTISGQTGGGSARSPEIVLKSRICLSIIKRSKCPHKQCRYAHSARELNIRTCVYDGRCSFVTKDSKGKLINKNKICEFKHADETKEECFNRITNSKN